MDLPNHMSVEDMALAKKEWTLAGYFIIDDSIEVDVVDDHGRIHRYKFVPEAVRLGAESTWFYQGHTYEKGENIYFRSCRADQVEW